MAPGSRSAKPGTGRGKRRAAPQPLRARALRFALQWVARAAMAVLALVVAFTVINPIWTPYMISERLRLGSLQRDWVSMEEIAPVMARAAVAAEDANFCLHWGFDMAAIRKALDEGRQRGASTISQQTTKNVFLWQGRSWPRKAAEAVLTPVVELVWSKRRILEVYLNVAEMGEGIFGVEAAAQAYFGVSAANLTAVQAARLAAVLPNPKARDASALPQGLRQRAAGIADGAATIGADGRARCFED
ncbi:monofunctional biosynthetic peptidoglycan transglycosylase [Frigidibacter albus]|uniref:Biosynthetic peptidoglycan transglycosylase n=2 Tax=Frigidibacter albus TaxID=1465486 RepID=A0A6L8VIP0_9RHOB|nr:monofunctional biosynthetic peptidoglycan transglycosylase [Frigidibacter albus]MZQ89631.1 monofunctional biosynthetic peptidoglycan transglycosylase [Frigidibacter albus]NBE31537.1 monofunctional biosynthetic peptidoglycan transglycosylase [Frigidibacter albus]GGH54965.1 monofunctional biosynthetic peptidoglycan transglycosylase [Frigidibacter albus]